VQNHIQDHAKNAQKVALFVIFVQLAKFLSCGLTPICSRMACWLQTISSLQLTEAKSVPDSSRFGHQLFRRGSHLLSGVQMRVLFWMR